MTTYKPIKRIVTLALVLTVMLGLAVSAYADTGPKASVRVYFENMGGELCYGTLLSARESTGPSSAWDGVEEHAQHNEMKGYGHLALDRATWQAFVDYEDADGYYFLQEGWKVSETGAIEWTYYPPSPFKILLYYPETGEFMTSGVYERYAFDSYFTVDMSESAEGLLMAKKTYQYGDELVSLLARIVITFVIEMAIALLFGFREKKQLLLLLTVNGGTQILLNVLLNIIDYNAGYIAFVLAYILFEVIVTIIEAVGYCVFMPKFSLRQRRRWVYVVYAVVANYVSFHAGLFIASRLPGIF